MKNQTLSSQKTGTTFLYWGRGSGYSLSFRFSVSDSISNCLFSFFHLTEFCWRLGCLLTAIISLLVIYYEFQIAFQTNNSSKLARRPINYKKIMVGFGLFLFIFCGIGTMVDYMPVFIIHRSVLHATQSLGTSGGVSLVKTTLGRGSSTLFSLHLLRIKSPHFQYYLRLTSFLCVF